MSRAAPAMPLFGDAYLADTRHLTLEQHGAYLQLLMIAWRTEGCCLPNDDPKLARMLGITAGRWAKLKPDVMAFWECVDGYWRQRRLTKEHAFVEEKRAKNSASAKSRWGANPSENIKDGSCERISERNAPPPPPTKKEEKEEAKASSKKKTRVPPDFWPVMTGSTKATCDQWPPGRLAEEVEQFIDHHTAKGTLSLDWQANWRTWVKLGRKFDDGRSGQRVGRHQPDPDGLGPTAKAALRAFGPVEPDARWP